MDDNFNLQELFSLVVFTKLTNLPRDWKTFITLNSWTVLMTSYALLKSRNKYCVSTLYSSMLARFQRFIKFAYVNNKSVALQLRRAKTDWSGCCEMTVQGALWLAKRLSLNLNFIFLNRTRYFAYQVATRLSSRGWVDHVPTLYCNSRKISRVQPGIEPGTSWMAVRRANHYTKHVVT